MHPPRAPLGLATLSLATLGLVACAHTLRIPAPQGSTGAALPALDPSQIDVPLSASVADTLAQLEAQVPTTFGTNGRFEMVGPSPVGIRYSVHREPFVFSTRDGALHAEANLSLQAEACVGAPLGISIPLLGNGCTPVASCGIHESPRRLVVSADTRLRLDSSWRLVSETLPGTPVFRDRCELTAFRVDVTSLAAALVARELATATHTMDEGIAHRGDLRPRAEAFWTSLQAPIDMGEGFWLSLMPQGVHAGPFSVAPDVVRTTVGITARPSVTAGAPTTIPPTPLPDVDAAGGDSSDFHITFDATVPFDEATALIAQEFRGRTLEINGRRALVRDIRVQGSGASLLFVIDVTFASGIFTDTQGTLYLAGLPDYDAATGDLVVRDLDYTLDTRNVLLQAGEWLMRGSLRDDIARHARFPLGARIARLRQNAQNALHRNLAPGTDLQGTLGDVRPVGAYVTPAGVVVRVSATGNAQITQDLSTLHLAGAHDAASAP